MGLRALFLLTFIASSYGHLSFYRPHTRFGNEVEADASFGPINITAKVDNFDPTNTATYQQRYWYNPTYSTKKDIVFLLIQGESIAQDKWVTNKDYTYLKLAASYGADVFQLEHRCFGFSRPFPDLTFDHLKYCTIAQALEDIHQFILKMNAQMKYTNPKWVTFGGSYPGALSALFRMNYPNDTVGAVASSAPMLWTLDMFQYTQVVNFVLNDTDTACWNATNDAFQRMQQLSLSNMGRNDLNGIFNLTPPFQPDGTTQLDIDNFFANIYGYFQDTIQYTYDGRDKNTMNGLGAKGLCQIMTNASETNTIQRVKNVIDWYNTMTNESPPSNSYSQMMADLSNPTYDDPGTDRAASRGWMWLCCNELGVLQTTDQGKNAFQQTVPLNYYIDMCTQMFDPKVDITYIRDHNYKTLLNYGGIEGYKATNVVLPNGGYDPWHVLGIPLSATDSKNHVTPILISQAGHCSDMYPKYKDEPKELNDARNIINNEVAYFLGVTPVPIQYDCC